ncbi:MAG: CheA signal transduction histidine kinase [Gemmatimonadetes bacterium]|nr:CheA signal transduction histidine kinase [Gemmatimonadota bacterium]
MDMDLSAIIPVFLAECEEGLAGMEDALLALEARPGDAEALNTVFRVAHTLKGNAANLGYAPAAEFAHELEDVLERLREGRATLTHALAGALLEAVDALRVLVPAATEGRDELTGAERALLARMAALASGGGQASAEPADSPRSAQPAAGGASAPATEASPDMSSPAAARAKARRTLRVNVEVLDRALDVVGEITIARGRLAQMMADGAPAESLAEAHGDGERLHLALQELVMRLRMVPLGPVFRPYVRTVRDLAFTHGKLARVVVEGEDVEVDTSVVEHLRDPLTHMVRNAVDHGIETPQARVAAGKDPCGTVTLSARHEGASLVVRMADDGAGLSRPRIAARARERGLAADPERMGDAELFRLILEPGFSTAETVTDLSGRGVGLDVVRRGIEGLRGSVGIASEPGRGTTITLRMPLTLALIEGFSVGVADDTFVLPLESVVECLELPRDRHEQQGEGVLSLRGAPLPFLRLRDFLGMPGRAEGRESVVVIRHDGGHAGVVVDALHGATQAVVKPLGRTFDGLGGFSGSTILGSGRVGLILDVPTLLRQAVERAAAPA